MLTTMPFDLNKRIYPYVKNGRFYNYKGEKRLSLFTNTLSLIIEWWVSKRHQPIDLKRWYKPQLPIKYSWTPLITWIGHSTFLIQLAGMNIITDPVFGRVPIYKRLIPPGIEFAQLPPIDYVLISHNHPDHFDTKSLLALEEAYKPKFLVPQGDRSWFVRRGIKQVTEFNWWDEQSAVYMRRVPDKQRPKQLLFSFLPAHHWSQRGLFDFNKSLWGSWLINYNGYKIYFGGDTAYANHFKAIYQQFGALDIAILPVGPCEPKEWLHWSHVNPEEAGQAFMDLRARHFIPMHWGTFNFGADSYCNPIERLQHWWITQQLVDYYQLHLLAAGEPAVFDITRTDITISRKQVWPDDSIRPRQNSQQL